jgi:hypothetical protein|tara:strand:- start:212 stop:556 length:345 start_codon:yes stop_codon:yes gene_type:complete
MAINYTWDVSTVDTFPTKDSKADVIHQVHWKLTATDDVNNDASGNPQTAFVAERQPLDTSDLSSFTAFASVTTSDVQGWVETVLGADAITELKTSLDMQIAEKVTPTSVTKTIE